ncbi:MAG TPA: adenylate/guanylate cyclase domain-containing protein [Chthoniobacterales bacterium]|nr:adenylate/guanylate cyclase domain-containing protein [Chthoniobacterales bacterium]
MPLDQQALVFRRLQDFVTDCRTADDAAKADELVRSPSGDGMALVFFGNCTQPLHCARELAEQIEADGSFAVRMGLHSGNVVKQLDVNGQTCASGDGVNIAQRVMDFGDGGHILMSLEYARALQEAGDPAADDCHDIGIAAAKHGRRVHLYNYHRPAVGTPDVPVKVRKDDEWVRPKQLRLGTSGRNIFIATLQLLGWLLVAPNKWRAHVNSIDPRLSPNFSIIDLTGRQIRRNPDLRELLLQACVVCPAMLALLIFTALAPFRHTLGNASSAAVAMMLGMGWLTTVVLGIGAGFVGFLVLGFQALVQSLTIGFFGPVHLVNVLALTAVCVWAFIALSAVFPERRRLPVWRDVLSAICGAFLAFLAMVIREIFAFKQSAPIQVLASAATAFVLINVVIGMRWRRWSRGFMFGQIISILAAVAWLAITRTNAAHFPVWLAVADGFTGGLMSCVYWAIAFTIAERLGDSAAAISAGLMVTVILNAAGALSFIPLGVIWITYAVIRSRTTRREQA